MLDFDSWYQAERPRILAVCIAVSGDRDAGLEATDEAFVRALERWPRVSTMGSPGGWTQTVALNYLRRALRRRGRAAAPPSPTNVAPPDLPDLELWDAVGRLPRRQQTAMVLRYVHDLAEQDIALAMGISRGTVASTLAAGRDNLSRLLADTDHEPEHVDGGPV